MRNFVEFSQAKENAAKAAREKAAAERAKVLYALLFPLFRLAQMPASKRHSDCRSIVSPAAF